MAHQPLEIVLPDEHRVEVGRAVAAAGHRGVPARGGIAPRDLVPA